MWHTCEEALAAGRDWQPKLLDFCRDLIKKYPFQSPEITHWYGVCKTQFPIYVEWWREHPEVVERTPLLQEYPFDVPYRLPSGRVVRLRGKFDAVDLVGTGREAGVYLFETKTKGDVDEVEIQRNLTWDLQTMMYLVALSCCGGESDPSPEWVAAREILEPHILAGGGNIKGVRYNVVRRPLSGGKGSITQGKGTQGAKCSKCDATGRFTDKRTKVETVCPKCEGACRVGAKPPETDAEFQARLAEVIRNATGPEWEVREDENYFFRRWRAEVRPGDVERFRRECLDPILEQMCDWYDMIKACLVRDCSPWDLHDNRLHWRHPFGAANTIDEYGASDMDEYVDNGSTAGLVRSAELFGELKS